MLPGGRALFNSQYAPRAHNLMQMVSRYPDAKGSASLEEALYPALLVFVQVRRCGRPLLVHFDVGAGMWAQVSLIAFSTVFCLVAYIMSPSA